MKKLILLLLLLPQFIIAQKQFAPLNATWRYELHTFDCSNYFLRYNVEKEVEIDNKDCSVIYAYTSRYSEPFVKAADSLIVWENDHKVYFYQYDEFHVLFDFNVKEGDTLDYFLPSNKVFFSPYEPTFNDTAVIATSLIVKEVTEIDINGTMLKKFKTEYTFLDEDFYHDMNTIVENVGTNNVYIIGYNQFFVASGCGPSYLCYENEDYSYPPNISCEYPTSTNNIYTETEIVIYPNPTFGDLNIINRTQEVIQQIEVTNLAGQKVNITPSSLSDIRLGDLSNGIYLVKILFASGNSHIQKIIKYN